MRSNSLEALLLSACLVVAASCNTALDTPPPGEEKAASPASAFEEGIISVELTEELSAEIEACGLPESFSSAGIASAERVFPDAGEWEERHRAEGLHRWYYLSIDDSFPVTKAADDLSSIPGIVRACPVHRKRKAAYFNDPLADRQWALYNDGSLGAKYTAGIDVNVVPVWERYCTGSPDVIVAVIDEGVQLDHPDLEAACLPAGAGGSKSFIRGYVGYNIQPGDHGSFVAGVIGAVNGNATGISGIAGGRDGIPGVRMLSCEIMRDVPDPSSPTGTKSLGGNEAEAFVWAADNGAVIASNSWDYVYTGSNEGHTETKAAIDYFIKYAGCDAEGNQRADSPMKGGLVLFAAGNDSRQFSVLAEYPSVVAVGAVSSRGSRAYYSNFGDWVDICAPGGDVNVGPTVLSCISGSRYGEMQGTSMACPQVAGVAALIVSYFGGEGFTSEMLKERLLLGANEASAPQFGMIGPLVDAMGSFSYGGTMAPERVREIESAESISNKVTLSWKVPSDPDDVKAYYCTVALSEDRSALEAIDPDNIPSSVTTRRVDVGRAAPGELMDCSIGGLKFNTAYYAAVMASDYAGNKAAFSEIAQITTGGNLPPEISSELSGEIHLRPDQKTAFTITVQEPDGHDYAISMEPGSDALSCESSGDASGGGTTELHVSINAVLAPHGTYDFKLRAEDSYGLASEFTLRYSILPNHAPVLVKEIEDILLSAPGESISIDFSEYFADEDGETLSYAISYSPTGIAHLAPSGGKYTLTAIACGITEITVTASDANGEQAKGSFLVLVPDSSRSVALYPNPVKSVLNVRVMESGEFTLRIFNKAGATVYSSSSGIDPFHPLAIDMSAMPSGTYTVHVSGGGIDEKQTIAKI